MYSFQFDNITIVKYRIITLRDRELYVYSQE